MLSHEFKPRSQGGLIVGWRSGGNLWAQQSGRIGKVPEIRFFFGSRNPCLDVNAAITLLCPFCPWLY
jgi:hypothetical protein